MGKGEDKEPQVGEDGCEVMSSEHDGVSTLRKV